MAKLRLLITDYGPVFSHGLIAGILAFLTFHSGFING
jgi:hypothetical protein